jgi:hypothetical protein
VIAAALNARYVELEKAQRLERPWKLGPSNLGGCLRQTAFMLSGFEGRAPGPDALRVFELGHQRGERLEELAKDIWPDAKSQVPVRLMAGKREIKGTADLWIPSKRLVVDFKTAGAYGAGLLSTEGASADYQLQIHAYRRAIGGAECIAPAAIKALIVYECKDSDARKGVKAGGLVEVEVPWTRELDATLDARLGEIERLLALKGLGQLDPLKVQGLPRTNWKCRSDKDGNPLYCPVGSKDGRCHE